MHADNNRTAVVAEYPPSSSKGSLELLPFLTRCARPLRLGLLPPCVPEVTLLLVLGATSTRTVPL